MDTPTTDPRAESPAYELGEGHGVLSVKSSSQNKRDRDRSQPLLASNSSNLESLQNKYILAVLRPSQILDCLVHRHQNSVFLHRKSKQIGIGDLLVPEHPLDEWCGKRGPSLQNRPKPIPGTFTQSCQHPGRLLNRKRTHFGIRHHPKKARLCKRTDSPIVLARCIKPLCHRLVVDVALIRQGDQHVDIGKILQPTQCRPPELPSPSRT